MSVYPVFFSAQNPAAVACPCIAGLARPPTTPDKFEKYAVVPMPFVLMAPNPLFFVLVPGPVCYLGVFFFSRQKFPQTNSVEAILTSRSEFPWLCAWPTITHHFNIYLTSSGEKLGCNPAIPPDWAIIKVNKLCTVCGSSIMYAPNIPENSIALGASKSTWAVAPPLIGAENMFTFTRNLKCASNYTLLLPPLFVLHSYQITGKRINAGVENSPRYPRNAIYFWNKSASPLMAKNLLAECTALMVSNFLTTHPTMIGSIMMRPASCITNTRAFN